MSCLYILCIIPTKVERIYWSSNNKFTFWLFLFPLLYFFQKIKENEAKQFYRPLMDPFGMSMLGSKRRHGIVADSSDRNFLNIFRIFLTQFVDTKKSSKKCIGPKGPAQSKKWKFIFFSSQTKRIQPILVSCESPFRSNLQKKKHWSSSYDKIHDNDDYSIVYFRKIKWARSHTGLGGNLRECHVVFVYHV